MQGWGRLISWGQRAQGGEAALLQGHGTGWGLRATAEGHQGHGTVPWAGLSSPWAAPMLKAEFLSFRLLSTAVSTDKPSQE